MPSSPRAYFLYAAFINTVLGQTTHFVSVGAAGSFYDPATISASLGDTVSFRFEGPVHSVIQCALENPCFPLTGGFSSGFAGRGDDFLQPAPQWDLKITNVSHPIWFFCASTKPVSHCASGMVGAINPPSIASYNDFKNRAKQVTATLSVGPSVVTSAPDAFATNSPLPVTSISVNTSTTPSSSLVTTSSIQPPETNSSTAQRTSPPSKPLPTGAIAGGAIAGGLFMIGAILTCLIILRRRHRSERGSRAFFRYKANSPDLGSTSAFPHAKMASPPPATLRATQLMPDSRSTLDQNTPTLSSMRLLRNNSVATTDSQDASAIDRIPRRHRPPHATVHRETSRPSLQSAAAAHAERDTSPGNIHALAREVAAVLMQGPENAKLLPRMANTSSQPSRDSVHGTESPAPPRYRS